MPKPLIHRFEHAGRRFAIDPETCFCFECDEISWDVLAYYPETPVNLIHHQLGGKHSIREINEVLGELEWLRATKSIVPRFKKEDLQKQFELERGLKRIAVCLPPPAPQQTVAKKRWFGRNVAVVSNAAREIGREAVALLLNRSGMQTQLQVEFIETRALQQPDLIAELCAHALKAAGLSGKQITAAVRIVEPELGKLPQVLDGHAISARLEFLPTSDVRTHVRTFADTRMDSLARLAKALQPSAEGVTGRVIVRPGHPHFGKVVETLVNEGFTTIELDLDGAYVARPDLNPHEMLQGLGESAVYYAQCLLQQRYFRLDPIAALFLRIYEGAPLPRSDWAGTNELAIDASGDVYPCRLMLGIEGFRLGSLTAGDIREDALRRFDDVGAATTGPCRSCWVRNLCGGGAAAVHYALTGSFRRPHLPWCEAQRAWMSAAVSAFNTLSSAGINFTRIYGVITRAAKPSLFTMVRTAFRMPIAMRPIEEGDAAMLTKWENWTEAAYFLFTETGLLLATKYDREMDSLHPQGVEQEMMLIRRDATPLGLLKLRPNGFPNAAMVWVYLRKEADYADQDIRKGFRNLLKEAAGIQTDAAGQSALRRIIVPALESEKGLQAFLEATGFEKAGVLREAVYIHRQRTAVALYAIDLDQL